MGLRGRKGNTLSAPWSPKSVIPEGKSWRKHLDCHRLTREYLGGRKCGVLELEKVWGSRMRVKGRRSPSVAEETKGGGKGIAAEEKRCTN